MSIELSPAQTLAFRRPFTDQVTQILRVRNTNAMPVAFKVKTTAPKQYCVRPNSGRIEADAEVEVQVLLQAMKEDPPLDYKCRDKFLVQSVAITPDLEAIGVPDIWNRVEKEQRKGDVHEWKIKCAFLPAQQVNGTSTSGGGGGAVGSSGAAAADSSRNDDSMDSPQGARHQRFDSLPPDTPVPPTGPVAVPASRPENSSSTQTHLPRTSATSSSSAAPANEDEDSTFRQRAVFASQQAAETVKKGSQEAVKVMRREAADGVPVPVVAALCLLVFLLAYFFF